MNWTESSMNEDPFEVSSKYSKHNIKHNGQSGHLITRSVFEKYLQVFECTSCVFAMQLQINSMNVYGNRHDMGQSLCEQIY